VLITYTADGEPPREWDLDLDDLAEEDAEQIEKQYRRATGDNMATYDMYRLSLYQGGATARRVLLWYLTTLTHKGLRFEDTPKFRRSQLKAEFSRGEYKVFLDRAMEQPASAERDVAVELIQRELATARDSLSDDESGKA